MTLGFTEFKWTLWFYTWYTIILYDALKLYGARRVHLLNKDIIHLWQILNG